MIIADLKGKLTPKEYVSEDFLTSTVFSAFDLLSNKWFFQFLNSSTNIHGESLKINVSKCKFIFWKTFSDPYGVEPDVLILLDDLIIILEAKFHAGKSGVGTSEDNSILYDQLAREYLLGNYLITSRTVLDETFSYFKDFKILYLTKDISFPTSDVKDSIRTLKKYYIGNKVSSANIFWTNWQSIYHILNNLSPNELQNYEKKLVSQLLLFLEKRDLIMYNGFSFLNKYNLNIGSFEPESLYYTPSNVNNSYWISNIYANEISSVDNLFYEVYSQYWTAPIFSYKLNVSQAHIFYERRRKYWQNRVFKSNPHKDSSIFYN
jgi:hypothetical protein